MHRNSVGQILAGEYLFIAAMPRLEGASCYENSINPESYFPVNTLTGDNRAARKICKECPVREACLNYALENHIREGIWGGYTGPERERIRWKRRHSEGGSTVRIGLLSKDR